MRVAVYSMTGYANAFASPVAPAAAALHERRADARSGPSTAARIGVELRSVNGRFLDLALRLPDEYRALEPALRELLTARFKRGKIELRLTGAGDENVSIELGNLTLDVVHAPERLTGAVGAGVGRRIEKTAGTVREVIRHSTGNLCRRASRRVRLEREEPQHGRRRQVQRHLRARSRHRADRARQPDERRGRCGRRR